MRAVRRDLKKLHLPADLGLDGSEWKERIHVSNFNMLGRRRLMMKA